MTKLSLQRSNPVSSIYGTNYHFDDKVSQEIKLSKKIKEFKKEVNERFPGIDFTIMNHNFNDLKIINYPGIYKLNEILNYPFTIDYATYDPIKNIIKVYSGTKESLYHELLHVSSKVNLPSHLSIGFYQRNNKDFCETGVGLNEGYTELLAIRLNEKANDENIYLLERLTAKMIEDVVGPNEMTNLYFKADLLGLIKLIKDYIPFEDVISIIDLLDNYCEEIEYICKKYVSNEIIEDVKLLKTLVIKLYQSKINTLNDTNTKSLYIDNLKIYEKGLDDFTNKLLKCKKESNSKKKHQ